MYETTSTYLQSELDYRADRLKAGAGGARKRSRTRVPRIRRPAEASDNAG